MNPKEYALQIEALSTGYRSKKGNRIVSQGINGKLKAGRFAALIGPNGSGKSTLLRTIAGLQPWMGGMIQLSGLASNTLTPRERAKLLSLVLTGHPDNSLMRVIEIVSVGRFPYLSFRGKLRNDDKKQIDKALYACRLEGFSERLFTELSDGEKQRVMIARALAQETKLILLDEPTAHLDLPNRVELMRMLGELAKQTKRGILISTHELNLALRWCDEIWLLSANGDIEIGTPEDLVLNGALSDVFSNGEFLFDRSTGEFRLTRPAKRQITLEVDLAAETEGLWTKRALERVGIKPIDDSSDIKLHVTTDGWLLETGKTTPAFYKSLHEVLANL